MSRFIRCSAALFLLLLVGWATGTCCQAASLDRSADADRLFFGQSRTATAGPTAHAQRLLFSDSPVTDRQSPHILNSTGASEGKLSVEQIASRISYVGVFVLTADRLIRSMDSVLETMQVRCADGTCLQLDTSPGSRGMGMGVVLSRPIEF